MARRLDIPTSPTGDQASDGARRRLLRRPLLWSAACVAAFLIAASLRAPMVWQGALLAVPLLIATIGWGRRAGLTLLPLAVALLGLGDLLARMPKPWWTYLGTATVMGLAVAAGGSVYRLWRDTQRRATTSARQAQLLSAAALELQRHDTISELYRALPRLLAEIFDFAHAEVFVPHGSGLALASTFRWSIPEGYELSADSVSGRAFRTAESQYVPDVLADPDYVAAPDAPTTRSELALPLLSRGRVRAVLNLEHTEPDAFGPDARTALEAFVRIAETALERLETQTRFERRAEEQGFVADLTRQLLLADSVETAARITLDRLLADLTIDAALVFVVEKGAFVALGSAGELTEAVERRLAEGIPWGHGMLGQAWRQGRSLFVEDYQAHPEAEPADKRLGLRGVAYVPLVDTDRETQAVLQLICFDRSVAWSDDDRRLIETAGDTLAVAMGRAALRRRLEAMLAVVRSLAQSDEPAALYRQSVDAAVDLIPGAEAASILVRQERGFRFAAARGFASEALAALPALPRAAQLIWYDGPAEDFDRGVPRLRTGDVVATLSATSSGGGDKGLVGATEGRTLDIRANICVPIAYQGEVIGVLNVDSFTREDAFGRAALELAEAFGQQVGVIIRQTQAREALERSVVTDPLTGLGNREGFNRTLKEELARAARYGQPLNLVMLDLDNFKQINDELGHQAGDRALIQAAQAMLGERRSGDSLFRWGGDEFALILPQVDAESAAAVAQRYARAIGGVDVEGRRLAASVGIASYPSDARDAEALLRKADDLMYRHKVREP